MSATLPPQAASPASLRQDPVPDLDQRIAALAMMGGAFFSAYHTWRPFPVLFTVSDALFCAAILMFIASGRGGTARPLGALTPAWLFAFILMLVGLLIGSIVNGVPARWAIAGAQYSFCYVVLPFVLVGHGPAGAVRLAKAALAGMLAMESFAIVIYYFFNSDFEENLRRYGPDFITGSQRLGAFLADGNWNGTVIAMTLPILLYLHQKRLVSNSLALVAAIVLSLALILAASVTGIACAVIGVLLMVVLGGVRIPRLPIIIALAAAGLYWAGGGAMPQAFSNRIAPAIGNADISEAGTFSSRMALMTEAIGIVGNTSLTGLGVDQYREVSALQAPVHNMYLLLWAEGGILALFGWVSMIGILACTFLQALRRDRLTGALGVAVLTSFVAASTASPHMYARLWIVPLIVAMAFVHETAKVDGQGD